MCKLRAMQMMTTKQEQETCNIRTVYYLDIRSGLECAYPDGQRALVSSRALLWLLEEVRRSRRHLQS
jgi:hypothetical protein